MFKDGDWQSITIDDRIPVSKRNEPAFGRCTDVNETVSIIGLYETCIN